MCKKMDKIVDKTQKIENGNRSSLVRGTSSPDMLPFSYTGGADLSKLLLPINFGGRFVRGGSLLEGSKPVTNSNVATKSKS